MVYADCAFFACCRINNLPGMNAGLEFKSTPRNHLADFRDYRHSPQSKNHWIAAVSGFKFCRETSFALSFNCFLIAGGSTRAATRLLARRLLFSNAEP